jgi:hypothetical protein
MNAQQDVMDLLETSLDELRACVLPQLSGGARTTGLMVANALGIALRVLADGSRHDDEELQSLQALMGEPSDDLQTLRRRLARQIRSGEMDSRRRPMRAARLVAHLALTATSQCSIDQPKALARKTQAPA